MSIVQTGEYQHAYVVYTASQRSINSTFLYRNIQKNKQELQYRLLLAFMKQKRSQQHGVLYCRSDKRQSFVKQIPSLMKERFALGHMLSASNIHNLFSIDHSFASRKT